MEHTILILGLAFSGVATIGSILAPVWFWIRSVDKKITEVVTVLHIQDRICLKREERIENCETGIGHHSEQIGVLQNQVGNIEKQIC